MGYDIRHSRLLFPHLQGALINKVTYDKLFLNELGLIKVLKW